MPPGMQTRRFFWKKRMQKCHRQWLCALIADDIADSHAEIASLAHAWAAKYAAACHQIVALTVRGHDRGLPERN
jgi:hypothetical protein